MTRQDRTYSQSDAAPLLARIPGWALVEGWLTRRYATEGWPITLMLVNAIGYIAEAADHHPDLAVSWSNVTVRLQTHSAGGVTDKDFELAQKIEEVALWKPPQGRPAGLAGTKRSFVRGDAS